MEGKPAVKLIRALLATTAFVMLVGCGSPSATSNASSPTPAPTSSASSPTPAVDVASARAAALTIFYAPPNANVWLPCSAKAQNMADCPFTTAVKDRLSALTAARFFGDAPPGVCGEDYITATQNGLFTEPKVLSAAAVADGRVSVVISRGSSPDLTATMASENGVWLASDLASGTGPAASIFSTRPNC